MVVFLKIFCIFLKHVALFYSDKFLLVEISHGTLVLTPRCGNPWVLGNVLWGNTVLVHFLVFG